MGAHRSRGRSDRCDWSLVLVSAVRVAVESPLLQLDREFDFLVPNELASSIQWGSRVKFRLGRAKTETTGLVVDLLDKSEWAKAEITSIVGDRPFITKELYEFCKAVSMRQVVALGEILQTACPPHMPRTKLDAPQEVPHGSVSISNETILTSTQVKLQDVLVPSWAKLFVEKAQEQLSLGNSSILIVPEAADVEPIKQAAHERRLDIIVWESTPKSTRYQNFHRALGQVRVIVGTRSAVYAPVANLGLIAVADDADDSYREVGSPHTNLRDLALLRAANKASVLFAAPYRSVEIQRLVEIGYLKEIAYPSKPPRIAYSMHGDRIDDTSVKLAREALRQGTLLVLLPRKGSSAAAYCQDCGERLRCRCGGYAWERIRDLFECRICAKPFTECGNCRATSFRRGRSGSTRTAAEIGRMFPNSTIYEATQEKKPEVQERINQIVVATPGSAPRLKRGYSGLLIIDPDIWLSSQSLHAEQNALRDWCEAMELISPDGRVVIAGLSDQLGRPLALWQHREIARASYQEAKQLRLPPAVRLVRILGTQKQLQMATNALLAHGAQQLRSDGTSVVFRFDYARGSEIGRELRAIATSAKAVVRGQRNVRGFSVVMDDLEGI